MDDTVDRIAQAVAIMRVEMANGFARVDERLTAGQEELREEIRRGDAETRGQMGAQMAGVREELGEEIRRGDVATRSLVSAQIAETRGQLGAQIAETRSQLGAQIADTRSQLSVQIESVRDDVRMLAEAFVPLEQRVTRLERRQN